jgi:hypothetical protein
VRSRPPRLNRPKDDDVYRVRCACRRWPRDDSGWFATSWEADEAQSTHADGRPGHHPLPFDRRPRQAVADGRRTSAAADSAEDDPVFCLSCGAEIGAELVFLGSLRCMECRGGDVPLDPALTARWLARGASF